MELFNVRKYLTVTRTSRAQRTKSTSRTVTYARPRVKSILARAARTTCTVDVVARPVKQWDLM